MSAASLPLPLHRPPPARERGAARALTTSVHGEHVVLHAERALEWPRERTLFVADVHLVAPFLRTVPGTDKYVDELWEGGASVDGAEPVHPGDGDEPVETEQPRGDEHRRA